MDNTLEMSMNDHSHDVLGIARESVCKTIESMVPPALLASMSRVGSTPRDIAAAVVDHLVEDCGAVFFDDSEFERPQDMTGEDEGHGLTL